MTATNGIGKGGDCSATDFQGVSDDGGGGARLIARGSRSGSCTAAPIGSTWTTAAAEALSCESADKERLRRGANLSNAAAAAAADSSWRLVGVASSSWLAPSSSMMGDLGGVLQGESRVSWNRRARF